MGYEKRPKHYNHETGYHEHEEYLQRSDVDFKQLSDTDDKFVTDEYTTSAISTTDVSTDFDMQYAFDIDKPDGQEVTKNYEYMNSEDDKYKYEPDKGIFPLVISGCACSGKVLSPINFNF